ncbi:MAG: hypothetical protein ACFCAD_13915 [Pleurocapsa sp.]
MSSKSIVSFGIPPQNMQTIKDTSPQSTVLPSPARSWYQNKQGELILSAQPSTNTPQFNSLDCHVR